MLSFFDRLSVDAPEMARSLGEPEAVNRRFSELAEGASAAWPGVNVAREALAGAVAAKLAAVDPPAFGADLVNELHLALACAAGDPVAITAFDRRYLSVVPQALAHMRLPAATVDAARAAVQEKLLVGEEGRPPYIVEYAGRGRLAGLVQVSAVRAALSLIRATARERAMSDSDLGALPSPDIDPELRLMKDTYRAVFAEAFAAAVRALEPRDRNLLRMHFLSGVTLDQLANMYAVHRATVVRWLAAARKSLLGATHQHMRARLSVPKSELDSILRLIESRLDVSVQGLLASMETPLSQGETCSAQGARGEPQSEANSTSATSREKG